MVNIDLYSQRIGLFIHAMKHCCVRYPSEIVLWWHQMKSGHYSIPRAVIPSL